MKPNLRLSALLPELSPELLLEPLFEPQPVNTAANESTISAASVIDNNFLNISIPPQKMSESYALRL